MEANALEKIYVHWSKHAKRLCASAAQGKGDIEYIRTDAFIEKACEYFHRCLEDTKVIDDYRDILVPGIQASYTSVEEFIEDFKRYMEE